MTNQFLWGSLSACCATVGLFFLKFWRTSGDRLFAIFPLAFWVFGVSWIGLALSNPVDDSRHAFYLVRLVAFLLIIGAIVDKNRKR